MSTQVDIVDGPLPDQAPCWRPDGAGAIVAFEGIVRPLEAEQPIAALRYQTYDPMAQRQLERLAEEAVRRFGLIGIRIWHSRGVVPVRACSFRLLAAAAHRREALAAVGWFIDIMKRDVPIWKHAVSNDGARVP